MPPNDLRHLATEYSVHHAALIIAGYDPDDAHDCASNQMWKRFPGYLKAEAALCNAIIAERLKTVCTVYCESNFNTYSEVNAYLTIVAIEVLDDFCGSRNIHREAFKSLPAATVNASSVGGAFYSKKLAAANKAWAAVTGDPKLRSGRSPKQALTKWLVEHAAEFDLLKKDGTPNKGGIDEICKVANWKPEGGATPTAPPALAERLLSPAPQPRPERYTRPAIDDLDDEIPF